MNQQAVTPETGASDGQSTGSLSYKFQRLRERLRQSVACGELSGKLPGERTLAKRFQVNAKTLSKALTDLAAEGLLDRSIGRGTYVKYTNGNGGTTVEVGAAPAMTTSPRGERWLVIADRDSEASVAPALKAFTQAYPAATVIHELSPARPSFLRQFGAVIDFATGTPDRFLRDMVVRNLSVVAVDREPGLYSINTIGVDRTLGAFEATRDLILSGHAKVAVVEPAASKGGVVSRGARLAAERYGATTAPCDLDQLATAIRSGDATAILCDGEPIANRARAALESAGLRVPDDVSLAAVGCGDDAAPCSGHFADAADVARAIAEFLSAPSAHRPAAILLAPKWVDRGTTGARRIPVG